MIADAAGPEAFVDQFLHHHAFEVAGAALDGPLDVVPGHRHGAGLVDGVAELEIHDRDRRRRRGRR